MKSFNKQVPQKSQPLRTQTSKSPIAVEARTRSVSSSRKDDNSKSQSKLKFISEMESVEKQLKNNKNKLCSCMQIYTMLQSSGQGQRCLQHNNILSLYCLNQRRILCVNCLYGMHKHRSHKVVPLKDCMDEVYGDNKKLKNYIEQEIKKIDYYAKLSEENSIVVETQMRKVISQMESEYVQKINQLKQRFQTSKKLIVQNFSAVIDKCRSVKSSLEDFRFNIWKAFTLYTDQKQTDENQIMKQLLFVTIVELCEFRNRTITKTQLQSLSRRLKQHF